MDIDIEESGRIVFLKPLSISLTDFRADQLKNKILELIEEDHRYFVLNLSFIQKIGSETVKAISESAYSVEGVGGKLVIYGLDRSNQKLIASLDTDNMISIATSEQGAIDYINDELI